MGFIERRNVLGGERRWLDSARRPVAAWLTVDVSVERWAQPSNRPEPICFPQGSKLQMANVAEWRVNPNPHCRCTLVFRPALIEATMVYF